jgi:hypothetical protein
MNLLTILARCSLVSAVVVAVTGCAGVYDPRDAPWDPRASTGARLFDQIPAWEGHARRRCGGQVRPELRTPEMTDRC